MNGPATANGCILERSSPGCKGSMQGGVLTTPGPQGVAPHIVRFKWVFSKQGGTADMVCSSLALPGTFFIVNLMEVSI